MAYHPPPHLVELLERTGLATAADLRAQARRVSGLARGLPSFDSLWLDALVQARRLTFYQASQIAAGHAEELRVGPFVCCRPLIWPQYVRAFQARRVSESKPDSKKAMLVVVDCASHPEQDLFDQLRRLAKRAPDLRSEHLSPLTEVGRDGPRVWAAAEWVEGVSAARLLSHRGRFEPAAALEIIRQMLAGLVVLEQAGLCHGDLCAAGLMLDRNGRVILPLPGLRAIVRPAEGYGRADLGPAAFDYLAPERIEQGTPPDRASDIYACGCLWWHMLTGRAPLGGGDSLGKLRAAQQAAIPDVRRLAPETPASLAAVISACLARDPAERPGSMSELAAMLGGPTPTGAVLLARQINRRRSGLAVRWHKRVSQVRGNGTGPFWLAVGAGCLLALGAALWGGWDRGSASALSPAPPAPAVAQGGRPLSAVSAGDSGAQQGTQTRGHSASRASEQAELGANGEAMAEAGAEAEVVPAEYRQVVDSLPSEPGLLGSPAPGPETSGSGRRQNEIVLRCEGGPLRLESLDLQPGQHLRGEGPARPVVAVPRGGLLVGVDGVRFENLDFRWQASATTETATRMENSGPPALIQLRCGRVEFGNCTFSVPGAGTPERPAALAWDWPEPPRATASQQPAAVLPTGRLRMENCVFWHVSAAVECRPAAAMALEFDNVLHVAPGPLLRFHGVPQADQPLVIRARRLTLRDSGPLVEAELPDKASGGPIGPLQIEATACVFAPRPSSPLILVLGGSLDPQSLVRALWWTGHGSLVAEDTPVASRGLASGRAEPLDEAALAIAGLVRSRVEFAGARLDDPAQSRVTGWQAPLLDPHAPGFDPADLVECGPSGF